MSAGSRRMVMISIHAPREGSDGSGEKISDREEEFQSTLPARGATARADHDAVCGAISIHAPREGSDG